MRRRKTPIDATAFRRRLLAWFRQNKRDLPWRRDPSPYKTWISEVMLQQTVVSAVVPYFERWMNRYPDVAALAGARESAVLRSWEGLGYYSRARNLRAAARLVRDRHRGRLPDDYDSLRRLPGIGDYTACAILSIAFHRPRPVIDANVRRVMSRVLGLEDRRVDRSIQPELDRLISHRHPGAFNEAMMEVGALICAPTAPRCSACPLAPFCVARASGMQERIGGPRRRERIDRAAVVAVALRRGMILLRKRLPGEIGAGLWSLPSVPFVRDPDPRLLADLGLETDRVRPLNRRIHNYTKYRESLHPFLLYCRRPTLIAAPLLWKSIRSLDRLAFPSVYRRILDEALSAKELMPAPARR